jgi:hypothetical protein
MKSEDDHEEWIGKDLQGVGPEFARVNMAPHSCLPALDSCPVCLCIQWSFIICILYGT